ncbi:MAG: hypothetical protein AB1679_07805 [Actinomycetota bacterium]|jgi:short subunit dehydrogenase-like uncharacterized protein
MGERIAVVGATGYTGRLVTRELQDRGVEVVAVGRHHPTPLVDAFDGCRAVINCIGSFAEHGDGVVSAAIAAGVPYVDISAEFPFLRRIFEVHHDAARKAGVPLLPGMAFYSAPADLAAALASRALDRAPDRVDIAYRLAGARPSRGTLRTNLRRIGEPCFVRDGGRLVARRIGDHPRPFRFPGAEDTAVVARWPGGEVLTVPRHTGAASVAVFLAMPKVAAAVFRNPRLCAVLQRAGRVLVGHRTKGPSAEARRGARFVIVAEARAADRGARCVVEGRDLYGVTAAACAQAALRLGTGGEGASGALAPAEAFDPAVFLDALSDYLTWRIEA